MATHRLPIKFGMPDSSGDVYMSTLNLEMTLTNAKNQDCLVFAFPTGSDITCETNFQIPKNYSGTPVLVLGGYLDGTPANVLAFKAQQLSTAVSESADQAYEAEDLVNNSTWTGYADEEYFEISITLTPTASFVVDDNVLLSYGRDDSVDTTTFNFLLTNLFFEYSDA